MPEISRFLGITIYMFYDDHNPPHIHVRYNEFNASMEISSLNILGGRLPLRVRGLVEEWTDLHRAALLAMWEAKRIQRLPPLV